MMKAVILENTWMARKIPGVDFVFEMGWGNGYVVLDEGHPACGLSYDDIAVDVHGGLTYAGPVNLKHLEMMPELDGGDLGKWMVGFDTGHYNDTLEKWPEKAVLEETNRLMEQLKQ